MVLFRKENHGGYDDWTCKAATSRLKRRCEVDRTGSGLCPMAGFSTGGLDFRVLLQ